MGEHITAADTPPPPRHPADSSSAPSAGSDGKSPDVKRELADALSGGKYDTDTGGQRPEMPARVDLSDQKEPSGRSGGSKLGRVMVAGAVAVASMIHPGDSADRQETQSEHSAPYEHGSADAEKPDSLAGEIDGISKDVINPIAEEAGEEEVEQEERESRGYPDNAPGDDLEIHPDDNPDEDDI